MARLCAAFDRLAADLRRQGIDILDHKQSAFDKAFVSFSVRVADLETSLQFFVNTAFSKVQDVPRAIELLNRFRALLRRDGLRADLDEKLIMIFHKFGLQLLDVQREYHERRTDPPIPRDTPPVAGAVAWAGHLFYSIEAPMKLFADHPKVLNSSKETKKIVKTYNRVARALLEF